MSENHELDMQREDIIELIDEDGNEVSFEHLMTLEHDGKAEFEEKRSVFISHARPVKTEAEALEFIKKIKGQYRDATHNVYAYLLDGGMTQRYSDDGEPQGTAAIRKSGCTDVVVVVTRYFGGTLLGAGGLVRAYSHSAVLALEAAHIVTYEKYAQMRLMISYSDYSKYLSELEKNSVIIDNTIFEENVIIEFAVKKKCLPSLEARLTEMSGGKLKMLQNGERFDFR